MTTATPPQSRGAGAQAPECSNCGYSGAARPDAWCPQCGYYPKLGRCVDLGADALPDQDVPLEPLRIPAWFWVMVAGSIGIAGMSLMARFNVPDDGPRTVWSLGQFIVGIAVFLGAHLRAYVAASFSESDLSPLDMVLQPFKMWSRTFQSLPEGNLRVRMAGWGVTAALCAMFLVGGMSYAKIDAMIVEYLPDPPASESVVDPVAEEAVDQKLQMTCVVIGYTRSVAGAVKSLLVADTLEGQPRQFVGKVMDEDIDESVVTYVDVMIPELARPYGTVACPISAYWLQPEVFVLVEYDRQNEEQLLVGARVVSIVSLADEEDQDQDNVEGQEGAVPDADDASAPADGAQATSSSSSSSSSS